MEVRATGTAVSRRGSRSQRIQAAMATAVERCLAEGVTDPEAIREAQLAARAAVRAKVEERDDDG